METFSKARRLFFSIFLSANVLAISAGGDTAKGQDNLFAFTTALKSISENSCDIHFQFKNGTSKTIDHMAFDYSLHIDTGGNIGDGSFSIKYVEPERNKWIKLSFNKNCQILGYLLIRDVTSCKIERKYYSGCFDGIGNPKILLYNPNY